MQAPDKGLSGALKEDPGEQKPSGGGGGGGSGAKKRGRPPQHGGSKEGKPTPKPPKPAIKSPVAKGHKMSGQKKAKEAGQTQAASTNLSGNVSYIGHRNGHSVSVGHGLLSGSTTLKRDCLAASNFGDDRSFCSHGDDRHDIRTCPLIISYV